MALGDLVKYALRIKNVVEKADDYQAVLLSAASRLDVADGDTEALERKVVSAREFVDKFPRNLHLIDDECSKWAEWIEDHPVLAAWVAQGGIEEQGEPVVADAKPEKKKSRLQQDSCVAELREASIKLCEKKVRQGIARKHITVVGISKELYEEGRFENDDLFSAQWRTWETIRGYLKGKYSPTRTERFKKAKPDKAQPFNT